jgi:hypothetical protein
MMAVTFTSYTGHVQHQITLLSSMSVLQLMPLLGMNVQWWALVDNVMNLRIPSESCVARQQRELSLRPIYYRLVISAQILRRDVEQDASMGGCHGLWTRKMSSCQMLPIFLTALHRFYRVTW